MNKNEQEQFNKFNLLLSKANENKEDIFFGVKKVEVANIEGYDAIVSFGKKKKKYVQLTTMSNLVIKDKDKMQHANKFNLDLTQNLKNQNQQKEKITELKKIGVERVVYENDDQKLHVIDTFIHIFGDEKDLDEKYNIRSANLSNALFREVTKKINKYNLDIKQENSCLVIIDDSENVFHKLPVCNVKTLNKEQEAKLNEFELPRYFDYILKIVLLESMFWNQYFFDEIQVYFRQAKSNISEEFYSISNNELCSEVEMVKDKLGMSLFKVIPMKNSAQIITVIKKSSC